MSDGIWYEVYTYADPYKGWGHGGTVAWIEVPRDIVKAERAEEREWLDNKITRQERQRPVQRFLAEALGKTPDELAGRHHFNCGYCEVQGPGKPVPVIPLK